MKRTTFLASLLTLAIATAGLAQDPTPPQTRPRQVAPEPPATTPARDDQDEIVRISTNLVQIDVIVTKDGKPVTNLQKEDFELFEDGKRQEISHFTYVNKEPATPSPATPPANRSKDKDAPPIKPGSLRPSDTRRTIALVVDDLGLSAESIPHVRSQIRKFVTEQLDGNDLVAIIRTGGQMGALQQFTNDRRVIDRAVEQIRWNFCSRVGFDVLPPVLSSVFGQSMIPLGGQGRCGQSGSVNFFNSLSALSFIADAMAVLPGRKAMVIFSDSIPVEDQIDHFDGINVRTSIGSPSNRTYSPRLNKIAEKAMRSSTVIYAVDASGLQYTGITAADNIQATSANMNDLVPNIMRMRSDVLQSRREGAQLIAEQTGGFLVRNSNDFKLKKVLQEQSGYYLIGYRPTDDTFNRAFHKIKAKVKKSGLTLRTRFGFYGVTEEETNKTKNIPTAGKMALALLSPFGAQDIEINVTSFFGHSKTTGSLIRSLVYLNARDLTFMETPDGWHVADIEVRSMLFGNNGALVKTQTSNKTISLRGATYDQALREGLTVQFDLPVRTPGGYQYRVAVRDLESSKIGASGQFVDVPNLDSRQLALSGLLMRGEEEPGAQTPDKENEVGGKASVRRFAPGTNAQFLCVAYNALLDQIKHQPNLVMQARLFRDSKVVYTSPEIAVDTSNQSDMSQVLIGGSVHLANDLEPGGYYLQVVLVDRLGKEKQPRPVMQWIDFEVVK